MKTIERDQQNTDVNILSINNEILIGTFFKEKPAVDDIIYDPINKINVTVKKIIENRNAKIQSNCNKNPKNAWFKLKIINNK